MNIIAVKSRNVLLSLLILAILLVISLTFFNQASASDNRSSFDKHLITIYDRGIEKVILTNARNIGDAIKEAGINLDDNDRVEPDKSEEIIASEYQVNIYRARPVVVIDGLLRQKIITAYQTPEQIAETMGIKLYPEDLAFISQASDINEGFGEKLTITRAKKVKLTLYGEASEVRTQADTVSEMLREKDIKITEVDKLSHRLDDNISENISIKIWREGQQTITVKESVDFDVEKIEDANRDSDYRFVKMTGEKGQRVVTYKITVINGKETSRKEIASLITKHPKKQVEIVGVKGKYNTPSENESITWSFLRSKGFSKIQAAGIMGNLMQEHKFNTSDTPNGLGLAQWTGGRRDNLIRNYPNSYETIYSQLDYLMSELNGGYAGVRDNIKSTNSLSEVVRIFQDQFERCNPYYCMLNQRITFAQNILASHE